MINETLDFVAKIVGLLSLLFGTALGFAKVMRWLGSGKRERDNYELAMIRENAKQLREENERCWADNDRLRLWGQQLEQRLNERRDQVHTLGNQLQEVQTLLHIYVMRFGQIEVGDDEARPRRDPQERRHPDENGEPQ